MQPQPHSKLPGQPTAVVARRQDEPLGDGALVALLGGIYLGGLGAFLAVALAVSQVALKRLETRDLPTLPRTLS